MLYFGVGDISVCVGDMSSMSIAFEEQPEILLSTSLLLLKSRCCPLPLSFHINPIGLPLRHRVLISLVLMSSGVKLLTHVRYKFCTSQGKKRINK